MSNCIENFLDANGYYSYSRNEFVYNQEDFKYGYLTKKCGCGDPVGMEKGSLYEDQCSHCSDDVFSWKSDRCSLCGWLGYPSPSRNESTNCSNCTHLENRGNKISIPGVPRMVIYTCIYCDGTYHTSCECSEIVCICPGCNIEPLTSDCIKPASKR